SASLSHWKGTTMRSTFGRYLNRFLVMLLLAAAVGAAGCSSGGTGTITGKVYYLDVPLKGGNVTFVSTDGKRTISTSIKEDGTYTLERVPAGNVKICVETESMNPAGKTRVTYSPPKDQSGVGYNPGQQGGPDLQEMTRRYRQIPEKYKDPNSTDQEYKV